MTTKHYNNLRQRIYYEILYLSGLILLVLTQGYQIQILEIRSFLFEIPEPLELFTFIEQVDEKVCYDLITIKRYDNLLGNCDFARTQVRFQNFIFSRAEPKKTCAHSFLLATIFIQHCDTPLFLSSLIGSEWC